MLVFTSTLPPCAVSTSGIVRHCCASAKKSGAHDDGPAWSPKRTVAYVGAPARAAGLPVPQLVLPKSTYRQFLAPLVRYIEDLRDRHPDRDVVVIVPDLVVRHWYHRFLHNNRGTVLRTRLRL